MMVRCEHTLLTFGNTSTRSPSAGGVSAPVWPKVTPERPKIREQREGKSRWGGDRLIFALLGEVARACQSSPQQSQPIRIGIPLSVCDCVCGTHKNRQNPPSARTSAREDVELLSSLHGVVDQLKSTRKKKK